MLLSNPVNREKLLAALAQLDEWGAILDRTGGIAHDDAA